MNGNGAIPPGLQPVRIGYTVIVPARNEAATVAATLLAMGADRPAPHRQFVLVCNGCSDDTAARARAVAPAVEVLECAAAAKGQAINAGLAAARHAIVIIADADVAIDRASLDALAGLLGGGEVWAASPAVRFGLAGCDGWVRRYCRVFARHDYLNDGVGGAGVYGLSAEGRALLGPFPAVASDDGWVRSRVPPHRQARLACDAAGQPVISLVRPPGRLLQLLRAEARWRRADRQLRDYGSRPAMPLGPAWLWTLWRRREIGLADGLCYGLVKLAGRLLAARPGEGSKEGWMPDRG